VSRRNSILVDWQGDLLAEVRRAMIGHAFWHTRLRAHVSPRLHLAILVEPYLQWILAGRKAVESRFSRDRRPPFQSVRAGDIVLLKRSAGPVLGIAHIAAAHYYELTPAILRQIRHRFAAKIGAETEAFWRQRRALRVASHFRLAHIHPLPPIACAKRDQRAWVVLQPHPLLAARGLNEH
jgi:hypothetical protein